MSNNITSKDKFSNQEFLREDSPKSLHEFSYTKNSYENLIELSNILQSNLKIDMIHNYNTFLVKNNIDINITDYIKVLNKKSFNIDINFIDDFLNCVDLNDCCINSNKLSKHNISTTDIENIIKLHNLILNKDYKISTVHDISGDGTYINYKVYYLHPNVFKLCLLKNYHLKYIHDMIKSILKEETEEIDQKVMNFLLRRYEINEINIDDRINFKELYFKVDDDYYLGISIFDSKKKQIRLIIDMLENNNVIEPIDNFSNENDPYRQKVVRTIKKFLFEIM